MGIMDSIGLGGVLDFVGDIVQHEEAESQFDQQVEHQRQQMAMQREFAQHGIRWRVEDAQAAGLHPLYALGGSGATYSPVPQVIGEGDTSGGRAISRLGQNISRAAAAQETEEQRTERRIRLGLASAQIEKDNAMAGYYWSMAAREAQEARASKPFPSVSVNDMFQHPGLTGQVQVKPDEVPSTRGDDPSLTAAPRAGFTNYTISPYGLQFRGPQSQEGLSEVFENIPWYAWPGFIAMNMGHFGKDWLRRVWQEAILDKPPKFRQAAPYRSKGRGSASEYYDDPRMLP